MGTSFLNLLEDCIEFVKVELWHHYSTDIYYTTVQSTDIYFREAFLLNVSHNLSTHLCVSSLLLMTNTKFRHMRMINKNI